MHTEDARRPSPAGAHARSARSPHPQHLHRPSELAPHTHAHPAIDIRPRAKVFVEDAFFERGRWGLKAREIVMTIMFWLMLLVPIAILANSAASHAISRDFYRWTYADGDTLVHFLERAIAIIVIVVAASTVLLLLHNNHRERTVYPERLTYDVAGQARRRAVIEQMYLERFGDAERRFAAAHYVVTPDQNLTATHVHDLLGAAAQGNAA